MAWREIPDPNPIVLSLKVSPQVADAVRTAARRDDRTTSHFLRRIVTAAVVPNKTESDGDDAA